MTERPIGILLAAGAGTRLGLGPKALLPFRGRTLVEVLADELLEGGCESVLVVLGAEAARVSASVDLRHHRVIHNPAWESGMGSSFRAGIAAAGSRDVLVALVDQPGLTAQDVRKVIAAHRPGRITAAAYPARDGALRRGHPIVFDARLAAEAARTAEGDAGGCLFLEAHPELIDLVDCSTAANVRRAGDDVDLPEHLYLLDEP